MKAEVIDNTPHGYDVVIHYENESCIIHEGMYHKGYAKKYADDFNSALSDHVRSELEKHGIITSPSKSFLDILSGNGKKIDADKFERMKQNYNAIMANSDVAKETETLLAEIDRLKREVERLTNIGHTPESEMNELSTRELIERLIASQLKVEKLEFMIEHGLGYEDMANDITMPHEV